MDIAIRTARVALALTGALLLVTVTNRVAAQAPGATFQQRLAMLQQQNASQQQRLAVQLAIQQTNTLLQSALRQDAAGPEQDGFYRPLNFQPQQSALQQALQQTTALQQTRSRTSGPLNQSSLSQISALQSALLRSSSLQTEAQIQSGQLTTTQIQSLFSQQASLMSLLSPPPPTSMQTRIVR